MLGGMRGSGRRVGPRKVLGSVVLASTVFLIAGSGDQVLAQGVPARDPPGGGGPAVFAGCTGTDPAWSPDGKWLALVIWCDEEADLWRVRPDGSDAEQLTRGGGEEHTPVWFPDGADILVSVRIPEEDSELWAIPADGGPARRLTDDDWPQTTPSFSPDGSRVVYESRRNDNADLFVLDFATGEEQRLTSRPEPDLFPRWSPDGSLIAFQGRQDGRYSILGISPGDGHVRELWAPEHHAAAPAWGPDGHRLVVAGSGSGADDLFLIDLRDTTAGVSRLMARDGIEFAPAWSPDDTHIAFIVREGDAWNVFVKELASGAEWRLTGSETGVH